MPRLYSLHREDSPHSHGGTAKAGLPSLWMTFHPRLLLSIVILALAAGGCAAPRAGEPVRITLGTVEADGSDALSGARSLYPRSAYRRFGYSRTQLEPSPGEAVLTPEAILTWRSEEPPRGEGFMIVTSPKRAVEVETDADGSIVQPLSIDREHSALTIFSPALLLVPEDAEPGDTIEQQVEVSVFSLDQPDHQSDFGPATHRVTYAGQQHIEVANESGHIIARGVAHRIDRELSMDLNRADVTSRTTQWLLPGTGLVLDVSSERVRLMGPFGWTTESIRVIVDR